MVFDDEKDNESSIASEMIKVKKEQKQEKKPSKIKNTGKRMEHSVIIDSENSSEFLESSQRSSKRMKSTKEKKMSPRSNHKEESKEEQKMYHQSLFKPQKKEVV